MLLYIDALFWLRRFDNFPASSKGAGKFLTADEVRLENFPPYLTVPAVIDCVTADGDLHEFRNDNTADLLKNFGQYIYSVFDGKMEYVGWYLDQIIIPSICANATICNVKIDPYLFRGLGDKWAKTAGYSVERAFMQGWYSQAKNDLHPENELTLNDIVTLSGMQTLSAIEGKLGDLDVDTRTLMARISAISSLYTRYSDIKSSWPNSSYTGAPT